jgi:hypothetical protein
MSRLICFIDKGGFVKPVMRNQWKNRKLIARIVLLEKNLKAKEKRNLFIVDGREN